MLKGDVVLELVEATWELLELFPFQKSGKFFLSAVVGEFSKINLLMPHY